MQHVPDRLCCFHGNAWGLLLAQNGFGGYYILDINLRTHSAKSIVSILWKDWFAKSLNRLLLQRYAIFLYLAGPPIPLAGSAQRLTEAGEGRNFWSKSPPIEHAFAPTLADYICSPLPESQICPFLCKVSTKRNNLKRPGHYPLYPRPRCHWSCNI